MPYASAMDELGCIDAGEIKQRLLHRGTEIAEGSRGICEQRVSALVRNLDGAQHRCPRWFALPGTIRMPTTAEVRAVLRCFDDADDMGVTCKRGAKWIDLRSAKAGRQANLIFWSNRLVTEAKQAMCPPR